MTNEPVTDETRAAWLAARTALDAIEAERAALLEPTRARHQAAVAALAAVEDDFACEIERCFTCAAPIFPGDARYPCSEDAFCCAKHAPTYADLLAHPETFLGWDEDDFEDRPLTQAQAQELVDEHLAGGGALTDSMAS